MNNINVINGYKTDDSGAYAKAGKLGKIFGIGRTTVWRKLKQMRTIPKYKDSFINLNPSLKLVKIDDFRQFLLEQSDLYLKK